ncbi:hypothetical protein GJV06_19230 [Enterobacteriaceae bacterium RIT691]|nr:hypothetical protein [Enterobacteriaceae bacterium RIT691]
MSKPDYFGKTAFMKMFFYALVGAVLAFFAGWFVAPYSLKLTSGNCAAETMFVYDEADRVVISEARWFTHSRGDEHFYMAKLKMIPDKGNPESVLVNRTVETDWTMRPDSLNVRTVKSFRIAGPEPTDAHWGRYIDPLAESGFHARIYLFRTEGGRILAGYKNSPVSTCFEKH